MTTPIADPPPARVLLVGMTGSGKSTVGRLLASRLGAEHLDNVVPPAARTRAEATRIVTAEGREAPPVAVTATLEVEPAKTASPGRRVAEVIGVAAGAIDDPATRAAIRDGGYVVWLRARPDTLARRIFDGSGGGDGGPRRPAASVAALAADRASVRAPLYAEVASLTLDVDDRTPVDIAQAVLEAVRMPACGWLPGPFAAVVFDLDGLLVETETIWLAAKRRLFAERGVEFRIEDHRAVFGSSEEYTAQVFARRFGLGPDAEPAIRDAYHDVVMALFKRGVDMRPGGRELIDALRGRLPLGLASNTGRPLVDLILEMTGLAGCFDAVVTGDDGAAKPAPDLYRACCTRLGVDPRASVAIEDSPTGLRAARAAGLTAIAIPSDPAIGPDGADAAFVSLADLIRPEPIVDLSPTAA